MAGNVSTRLRFQAKRDAFAAARETTSGDILGVNTGDMVKYFAVDKEKIHRAIVYVVTADTLGDTVIQLIKLQTMDQNISASGATTIDFITISATDNAAGRATYKDMSPASADMEPGEQLCFRTQIGGQNVTGAGKFTCWVIVEPTTEVDANLPYPKRMNKST